MVEEKTFCFPIITSAQIEKLGEHIRKTVTTVEVTITEQRKIHVRASSLHDIARVTAMINDSGFSWG